MNLIQLTKLNFRLLLLMVLDLIICAVGFLLSFALRLGVSITDVLDLPPFNDGYLLILVVVIQIACFYIFGIYRGLWRFTSTRDLWRIIMAVSAAIPLTTLGIFLTQRLENVPRAVFLIDWFILVVAIGGIRLCYRLLNEIKRKGGSKRAIIVGAGKAGEQLCREFQNNASLDTGVVAFVDDNSQLIGKQIHGVSVMGRVSDIASIAQKVDATEIIIAIADAGSKEIRHIVDACNETTLELKKIPSMGEIIGHRHKISQIKKVSPEDLLGRDQVVLDNYAIGRMIEGKTILITGAGGSIGSELCRQMARYNAGLLLFYDVTELFLYHLDIEFANSQLKVPYKAIIGNVRDENRLKWVFEKYHPDLIFHAAAYKHVPMMEENPAEAIRNNIQSTLNLTRLAVRYKVEKFVLVSTDKAVNPTNVMGATKRICELVVQTMQKENVTKFMAVRFGNVLGSAGSVIPLFRKQIENGGPVTVTHPDITRYFMSIPEASQLVLQAGALGKGGEVFVLEMGEPIKIVDLAREMIILSGFVPEKDIQIKFTGLRPGEKLYEELLTPSESSFTTSHPGVRVAQMSPPLENLMKLVESLLEIQGDDNRIEIINKLRYLVPEYMPSEITETKRKIVNE